MKVKAIKLGFYVCRRYPGDVFDVPETFKASWVEVVEQDEPVEEVKKTRKSKVKDYEPETFSEIAKVDEVTV